jgi:hypothetical protein
VKANWPSLLLAFVLALSLPPAAAAKKPPPNFVETADQSLPAPPADQAQLVFLEPINGIQGLFPVGLYELEGDKRTLLAITGAHSKAIVNLSPGHHFLMANHSGMIAHFLDANVEAGKRYYVLVRFLAYHGFQLRPVRTGGASDYSVANPEFASWYSTTRFVQPTPEGVAMFDKLQKNIDKSQAKGLEVWNGTTPEQRAELTHTPADAAEAAAPAAAAAGTTGGS